MHPNIRKSGNVAWKLEEVDEWDQQVKRIKFRCDTIPMKMSAFVEESNGEKELCIAVKYNGRDREEKNWICEVTGVMKLEYPSTKKKCQQVATRIVKCNLTQKSYEHKIRYDLDELEKLKIMRNGQITLNFSCGIRLYNYSRPDIDFTNVKVIVQRTPFFVSKDLLTFGCRNFPQEFIPGDDFFTIDSLDPTDFALILASIDPGFTGIDSGNTKQFLKLDKLMNVPAIHAKCEYILIHNENMDCMKKLRFSERYSLSNLMDHCLDSLKTSKQVKAIHSHEKFDQLEIATRLRILDKYKEYV